MKDDDFIHITVYRRDNNPVAEFYFSTIDDCWKLIGNPQILDREKNGIFINLKSDKLQLYIVYKRTPDVGRTIWQELQEVGFKILKDSN